MRKHIILLALLIVAFSSRSAFSQIDYCYDWDATVYGYSELLHDDQAMLVSGLAGTDIVVNDYTPWFCDHTFDAWVYSELANSSGILSSGRLESSGWSIEGQHSTFSAQYGTYCVTSSHGLVDYWSYYDGEVYYFFTDEYTAVYTQDCHTFTPPPPPTPTPTPTPTPSVVSVTFSQVNPSTEPISPNPAVAPYNPGIGLRIFPDDDTPGDTADHRVVRVTATLSQPIANVPVYFRNFDLDDPANDPIIDPYGTLGDDNNETQMPRAGQLLFANGCGASGASVYCPTNANGVATIDFVVTRQPGDNFAVAAGTSSAGVNAVTVNGIELADGNGQNLPTETCPTQSICRSQMLTVWRRLHIEVDSMGPSQQNFVLGNFATGGTFRAWATMTFDVNTTQPLEPNRFEGGRLLYNGRQIRVVSNTDHSVTLINNMPPGLSIYISASAQFQMFDDDDFNNDDGFVLDGDTGEDILAPDEFPLNGTALLTAGSDIESSNVFSPAYVRPVYDIADSRDNCLFQSNSISDDAADLRPVFRQCWDSATSNTDPEFWYVVVFGAYQHTLGEDGDPATEDATAGIVDEITGVSGDREGSGATIFMEAHRTRETPNYNSNPQDVTSLANTVAHEVAHLLSCRHGELGLMGDVNGYPLSSQLTPTSISRIRIVTHP